VADRGLDAVLFDIDDTLFSSTDFAELARKRAIDAMIGAGLHAEPERVRKLLQDIIGEYSSNFPYQFDELLSRLNPESYRPVSRAIIVASAVVAYHDTKFQELHPYEDVPGVLEGLKARGARLGVVSHGIPIKQSEKLVRLGLVGLFEPGWVFITEEMEMSKDEPRFWREVARRAGVAPERAAYVGDHPVSDVDTPNAVGMVTILVKRGGKYSSLEPRTPPRHEIRDFRELDRLLREEYGV
jgi:putative hydrolase of the HAD superfamily